jgi:hypothetical protein
MQTWIYRSSRKPDLYIYLAECDDFSKVPANIIQSLGIISFAMELEISESSKLARENPETVLHNLSKHGFHLQLPPQTPVEQLMKQLAEKS